MDYITPLISQIVFSILAVAGFMIAVNREKLAKEKTLRKMVDELQVQLEEYRKQISDLTINCQKQELELKQVLPIAARVPLLDLQIESLTKKVRSLQDEMEQ